jgi:hypothetical protein
MKLLIVFTGIMLLAAPLLAETYSWVDEKGTYNFTEDYSRVPQKYRKNVEKRDGIDAPPTPVASPAAVTASPAGSATKGAAGTGKEAVNTSTPEQLFDGKTRAAWQQELNAAQNELKRLEARVKELEVKLNNAGAYNVTRAYRDEQQQYYTAVDDFNKATARFVGLMESARKAGL